MPKDKAAPPRSDRVRAEEHKSRFQEQDDYLEEALEETFPASDPIAPGHPSKDRAEDKQG
jgi:hypothetical protein